MNLTFYSKHIHFRPGKSAYVLSTQRHSKMIKITCVLLCLINVNQKELLFQPEVWLYWELWGPRSHGRTRSIANHALAFTLHGLCGKWQQPQAYYLNHGSTKGEILVGVLDACHSSGLVVVAMCDIGANSVKAKKQLDVSRRHLSSGFSIKILQHYLSLRISLNVPTVISQNVT